MKYANCIGYSDVTPWEVISVISGKTIEIRPMDSVRDPEWKAEWHVGGFAGHCSNQEDQKWIITSSEDYKTTRIRLNSKGQWKDKHGQRFVLADAPRRFYDFNF